MFVLKSSKSNSWFQILSSPSTSDFLVCPSCKISWILAPSKLGLSRLRTIVQVIYGLRITATTVGLFRTRTTSTPSSFFWVKTPSTRTSLSLAWTRSTWARATFIIFNWNNLLKAKQIKSSKKKIPFTNIINMNNSFMYKNAINRCYWSLLHSIN